MLNFLFVDKRELFVMKLSFEELCYYQQVLILNLPSELKSYRAFRETGPAGKLFCFICRVCIQNQSINNFENDKMQN